MDFFHALREHLDRIIESLAVQGPTPTAPTSLPSPEQSEVGDDDDDDDDDDGDDDDDDYARSEVSDGPMVKVIGTPAFVELMRWEPENVTETLANGLDAWSMAEDMFFYDLVCAFTDILFSHYRRFTHKTDLSPETGLYSVVILDKAGPAPPPPEDKEAMLDRRTLSWIAGTIGVKTCDGSSRSCAGKEEHSCCCCCCCCVDVQALARKFMWWFISARARIRRPMPPQLEADITSVFRLHSERCTEEDERDWEWRRYAVYNLLREIRDPLLCRPGYVKPEDGQPIRRPWTTPHGGGGGGDQYVHGMLSWGVRSDGAVLRELRDAMKVSARERLIRRRDPELATDLWDIMRRKEPDPATLPPMCFASARMCSNPKRERDAELWGDLETAEGKQRELESQKRRR